MIKYFPVVKASYRAADAVQQSLCRQLLDYKNMKDKNGVEAPAMALLSYEMEPAYTFGRRQRGQLDPELIHRLRSSGPGAEVVETLRGGFATFHGPGQLVMYPILDLQRLDIKIRDYVCILEKSIISTLGRHYGIEAEQRPGAGFNGVWIKDAATKVASVGVHVRRNVTSHGLALNVDVDPFWFQQIVPCNLKDVQMASIAGLMPATTKLSGSALVSDVGFNLVREICTRLGVEPQIMDSSDSLNLLKPKSEAH